jgi:hypothetical protein
MNNWHMIRITSNLVLVNLFRWIFVMVKLCDVLAGHACACAHTAMMFCYFSLNVEYHSDLLRIISPAFTVSRWTRRWAGKRARILPDLAQVDITHMRKPWVLRKFAENIHGFASVCSAQNSSLQLLTCFVWCTCTLTLFFLGNARQYYANSNRVCCHPPVEILNETHRARYNVLYTLVVIPGIKGKTSAPREKCSGTTFRCHYKINVGIVLQLCRNFPTII